MIRLRPSRARLPIALSSLAVSAPRPGRAAEAPTDPMRAAAFAPNPALQGDETGFVNVLTGDLTIPLRIGLTFTVNEALSYGVTLTFSSNHRRWVFPTGFRHRTRARGRTPFGWGWTWHFGRITINPEPETEYVYQDPTGTFHELQPRTATYCGAMYPTCYTTRDGSFIRAVRQGSGWLVWTPDGVERELFHEVTTNGACATPSSPPCSKFDATSLCTHRDDFAGWYTTRVWDPVRADRIDVFYEDAATRPGRIKRVVDSVHGQTISLTYSETLDPDSCSEDGAKGGIATKITVATAAPGNAVYNLEYDWAPPPPEPCLPQDPDPTGDGPNVGLLKRVWLDSGNGILRTWVRYGDVSSADCLDCVHVPVELELPGDLADTEYSYTCQLYGFYNNESPCGPCDADSSARAVLAVTEKRVGRPSRAGSGCGDGGKDCWTYDRDGNDCPDAFLPCGPLGTACPCVLETNPLCVDVTLPAQRTAAGWKRHSEKHYFTTGCSRHFSYDAGRYPNGLERRVEYFDGSPPTGAPLRVVERDYRWDYDWGFQPGAWDVRSHQETTIYSDRTPATATTVARGGWDGRGHFTEVTETTTEGAAEQGRTAVSRKTRLAYSHTPQHIEDWFLGSLLSRRVFAVDETGGEDLELRESFSFDRFGRLTSETRHSLGYPGSGDVQVLRKWNGHEMSCEVRCGGDPADALACPSPFTGCGARVGCAGTTALNYATRQVYRNGVVSTRQRPGMGWFFYNAQAAVDGAVEFEFDTTGRFGKQYSYDRAGRLKDIRFKDLPAAPYEDALFLIWQSPHYVRWIKGQDGEGEAKGGIVYDAYGRRRAVSVTEPVTDRSFAQWTDLDAFGNLSFQSDRCRTNDSENPQTAGACQPGTLHLDYDPFGRVGRIRHTADGGADTAELSYQGLRTTRTTWKRPAGAAAGQPFYVESQLDGFGRLVEVREHGDPSWFPERRKTSYTYDAVDRLLTVSLCAADAGWSCVGTAQMRSFTYDGLGNLRVATEPESGTTNYTSYDAGGHLRRWTDARENSRIVSYDCAERVTGEANSMVSFRQR